MRGVYHIEAPVETVFDFFFDPRKSVDASPVHSEIRELKMTKQGTGSYATYRTKIAGVPWEVFDVYTDVVRNKHITEKSSSPIVGTWDYTFEPEGMGTKVTMEHHSRSFWDLPLVRNVGDVITARLNEYYMRRVKERIEAPSS